MAALNLKYLLELEAYLKSGDMAEDFKWSVEERRHEMLEFLEKLMDLGELADEAASRMIFSGSLGMMLGAEVEREKSQPGNAAHSEAEEQN